MLQLQAALLQGAEGLRRHFETTLLERAVVTRPPGFPLRDEALRVHCDVLLWLRAHSDPQLSLTVSDELLTRGMALIVFAAYNS